MYNFARFDLQDQAEERPLEFEDELVLLDKASNGFEVKPFETITASSDSLDTGAVTDPSNIDDMRDRKDVGSLPGDNFAFGGD